MTSHAIIAGALVLAAAFSGGAAAAEEAKPIKLAVFDFEMEDFSAGGPIAGQNEAETERLRRVTQQARELLTRSGLFELVPVDQTASEMGRSHWLRHCNGCEADMAAAAGADYSFLGVFHKVSIMEQSLEFRFRATASGQIVQVAQTDLRNETDESWRRAIEFLIRYRVVEPEIARRQAAANP